MTQIDVELSPELQEALTPPQCLDLSLPKPGKASLTLPTGGTIQGIADATRAIPTDCSLSINLMVQLGPILANIDCIIKILKLIEPLINIVKGLPFPPAKAIKDFGEAVPPVMACITALTGAGLIPFVKDIICLVIKVLGCVIDQLKSLIALVDGLQLDLEAAQLEGNDDLAANIECAQENAMCAADAAFQTVEPVMLIMGLVTPLFELVPASPVEIPSLAAAEDVESMKTLVSGLEGFVEALKIPADALGGC